MTPCRSARYCWWIYMNSLGILQTVWGQAMNTIPILFLPPPRKHLGKHSCNKWTNRNEQMNEWMIVSTNSLWLSLLVGWFSTPVWPTCSSFALFPPALCVKRRNRNFPEWTAAGDGVCGERLLSCLFSVETTQGLGSFELYLKERGILSLVINTNQPIPVVILKQEAAGLRRGESRKWGWYPNSVCTRVSWATKDAPLSTSVQHTMCLCNTARPLRINEWPRTAGLRTAWQEAAPREQQAGKGSETSAPRSTSGSHPDRFLPAGFHTLSPALNSVHIRTALPKPHNARKKAWAVITQGSRRQKTRK